MTKDIQYGTNIGIIRWKDLTKEQKEDFIAAKHEHIQLSQKKEMIEYLFYREGKFQRNYSTERLDTKVSQALVNHLKAHLNEEAEIYKEDLLSYEKKQADKIIITPIESDIKIEID